MLHISWTSIIKALPAASLGLVLIFVPEDRYHLEGSPLKPRIQVYIRDTTATFDLQVSVSLIQVCIPFYN